MTQKTKLGKQKVTIIKFKANRKIQRYSSFYITKMVTFDVKQYVTIALANPKQ